MENDLAAAEEFLKACKKGDLEHVLELVSSRIDVNIVAANNQMPALAAISKGKKEVIQVLLDHDLIVTDQMIQNAVMTKRPQIAEMLITSSNEKSLRKSWLLDTRAMANERGLPDIAKLISSELL